jgi:hypothetical protein
MKLKLFEKNVGKEDRIIRLVAGVIVAIISQSQLTPPTQYVGFLIAIILLFTGAIGSCTLYTLLRINTKRK